MACKTCAGVVAAVTTVTSVLALFGVWTTHSTAAGWTFGTTDGSLALLVLIVSLAVWLKTCKKLCPCGSKCGCGGGCGCGKANCDCGKKDGPMMKM
jgi:hypothetical protein